MTPRAQQILFCIVKGYIDTGEPQGSGTISRVLGTSLSPATIRNIMSDLTEAGYLLQPHTSAGRIPTEKGFQAFVNSLTARPLPQIDLFRIRERLSEVGSFDAAVATTSQLLTEMTQVMGITAAIRMRGQELDRIELINLSGMRVLIVVIARDGNVRNRIVTLPEELGSGELESIRNYINQNFSGWLLEDARREIQRRLVEERAAYDQILRQLNLLHEKGLFESDEPPQVHTDGASNLVGFDLHLTSERLRELFRTLEEKKRVVELLDRFLDSSAGDIGVQIGLAEAHPAMKELALIGISLTLPGGLFTRIAVLGPLRMNYGRAIATVLGVGRALEKSHAA